MKIGTLEMKIARVEGFQVRMPPWPYKKAARDRWSVSNGNGTRQLRLIVSPFFDR